MAFEDKPCEMTCKACGAQHKMRWYRIPLRERTTVNCMACGGILFQGNANRDFYDVRLADST